MNTEPPERYLGADGRIQSGPAQEMVEAGFELEVNDAPLLHRGLNLADLAHVMMLGEQRIIPRDDQLVLIDKLLQLIDTAPEDFPYTPLLGDAYNSREKWLDGEIGTAAGWLAAGRPRREAGRIAFRIALREQVTNLLDAVVGFAGALTDVAERNLDTVMADYTYLQAAQPTTLGHYLLSFAYPALRDGRRLQAAFDWVNRSPGGAGGVAGSTFPIARQRVADLLGFDGLIEHTRDAIWQTDGLVTLVTAAALSAINASRLAEDLEIYTSAEFGLLSIGDEFCRASVLMPQKRNPYALAVLRGGAGTLIGRVTGLLVTQRTPSARTDNLMFAYHDVSSAVSQAAKFVKLAAAVARTIQINPTEADRGLQSGFAQSTDLAEAITEATGVDYRSAYRVVARAVAKAADEGSESASLDEDAIEAAARSVMGRSLSVSNEVIARALDPPSSVKTRTQPGSTGTLPMREMITSCLAQSEELGSWSKRRRRALAAAEAALITSAKGWLAEGRLSPD